jgi:uncharacterized protein YggL (DUF469 family)
MKIAMKDLLKKDVILVYRNDDDKKFHLAESQSMIAHVDHMFSSQIKFEQFSQLLNDVLDDKVSIEVIEYDVDKFVRQIKMVEYRNEFLGSGYTEYSATRFTDAKVHVDIAEINQGHMYAIVYMTIGTKPRTVLGVFDTMEEANTFFNDNYYGGKVNTDKGVILADNELSQKMLHKVRF